MAKKIVVIGAGVAGLSAAWQLKQHGFDVTVLEACPEVGGAMKTLKKDGFLAETGPNTIMETSPRVTEIITALGLDDEKEYGDDSSNIRYVVKDKKPVPLPTAPGAFLSTHLFSVKAKLRVMKELFTPGWDNRYEENLAQFVLRRLGKEFLDYAINPFVSGVYAGMPEHLSVKHALPKLYALEQRYGSLIKGTIQGARERKRNPEKSKQSARMFSFKSGLSIFPHTLEKALGGRVMLNAPVSKLTTFENGWEIFYPLNEKEESVTADMVLYAGSATKLPALTLNGAVPPEFAMMQEIYHPPVSVLTLGFKREQVKHSLKGFGVLIPAAEKFSILGTLFSSTLFSRRAPEGHVALTVFAGGARVPEVAKLPKDKLIEVSLKELDILLGVKGNPVIDFHSYWEHAIPQYDVGHGRFKDALDQMEAKHRGLYFTGNYRFGISAADSIKYGQEMADRIIQGNRE